MYSSFEFDFFLFYERKQYKRQAFKLSILRSTIFYMEYCIDIVCPFFMNHKGRTRGVSQAAEPPPPPMSGNFSRFSSRRR
jgi:hypothetical protein